MQVTRGVCEVEGKGEERHSWRGQMSHSKMSRSPTGRLPADAAFGPHRQNLSASRGYAPSVAWPAHRKVLRQAYQQGEDVGQILG